MTGRTHDAAAATALLVVVLNQPARSVTLATALVGLLANQIGGITPDIDEPTAPLWRNLPVGGVIGRLTDKFLGGHRFLTHSLLGAGLFGALAYGLLSVLHPSFPRLDMTLIWWAFMIGLLSHLVMDTFTKEGVPWLLPVPIKFGFPPIKALRITTGQAVESFVIFPGLAALAGFICWRNYDQLLSLVHHHLV